MSMERAVVRTSSPMVSAVTLGMTAKVFPDYSNRMSKAVLKIPFPFSFRLDIGVNSDLNLNSARDQIIYDEKWLTFEENLYRIICRRLKDILSSSNWKILNEIIQKNNTDTFCRVANSFE